MESHIYCEKLVDIIESEPHFLVGGTTGSGKSVLMNTIITSLTTKYSAAELSLFLIDPKRTEFYQFRTLPHIQKVATERDEIYNTLLLAVQEIERRFTDMQKRNIRTWDGFRIYIFIDEVADLMITDKKRCVPLIQRITQIGRAARVHLVCATQILRREILPLTITANISGRIALRCDSVRESRQILGDGKDEAASLPRHGQAIVKTTDVYGVLNIPYITTEQFQEYVDDWKEFQPKKFRSPFKNLLRFIMWGK